MFVKHESAAEIGTTRASINRTGKTNAAKGITITMSTANSTLERQRHTYVPHLWK